MAHVHPAPPHDPVEASLSPADDRVRLNHWLPPQAGVVPRIRIGQSWVNVLWALPIAFVLLVIGVAIAQALRQVPAVQEFLVRYPGIPQSAVADIPDGASVMVGGFGTAGMPDELIDALIAHGARELTIINNNAGNGDTGLAALIASKRVRKVVCSFPRQTDSWHFDAAYKAGEIELELVPQGNLAARIHAAGSGLGAIFTPTGYGTELAAGKETREIDGRHYVLEYPLHADFALIKADRGDRWGNLVYRKTARNFGPLMAMAAKCTIAQVSEVVALGELDPEAVVTPGIFVHRVVAAGGKS